MTKIYVLIIKNNNSRKLIDTYVKYLNMYFIYLRKLD